MKYPKVEKKVVEVVAENATRYRFMEYNEFKVSPRTVNKKDLDLVIYDNATTITTLIDDDRRALNTFIETFRKAKKLEAQKHDRTVDRLNTLLELTYNWKIDLL